MGRSWVKERWKRRPSEYIPAMYLHTVHIPQQTHGQRSAKYMSCYTSTASKPGGTSVATTTTTTTTINRVTRSEPAARRASAPIVPSPRIAHSKAACSTGRCRYIYVHGESESYLATGYASCMVPQVRLG